MKVARRLEHGVARHPVVAVGDWLQLAVSVTLLPAAGSWCWPMIVQIGSAPPVLAQ
jgi:hypothetical protein